MLVDTFPLCIGKNQYYPSSRIILIFVYEFYFRKKVDILMKSDKMKVTEKLKFRQNSIVRRLRFVEVGIFCTFAKARGKNNLMGEITMKKLGLTILACFMLLGIAMPMVDVEAQQSGVGVTTSRSSWHWLAYGHHGGGTAFTEHSQRYSRAGAGVGHVVTGLSDQDIANEPGQTARAIRSMVSTVARTHFWWDAP